MVWLLVFTWTCFLVSVFLWVRQRHTAVWLQGVLQEINKLDDSFFALQLEHRIFKQVLTHMKEGVCIVNHQKQVIWMNQALQEMLFITSLQSQHGVALLELIRNIELKKLIEKTFESQSSLSKELIIHSPIQERLFQVQTAYVVAQEVFVLVVLFDVTHLRQLELQSREFVAHVSHELRTPLTSILSATDILKQLDMASSQQSFVEMIARNALRLNELVEDLIALARVENRQGLHLHLESLSLAQLIDECIVFFTSKISEKQFNIKQFIPQDIIVYSDKKALEHIFMNLIDNALKYCPLGSTLGFLCQHIDELQVRVLVRDNGPGIESVHLPRLFERFYRVEKSRSRETGGSGLGLAIVKQLVDALGQDIAVKSEVNVGTEFIITLPKH